MIKHCHSQEKNIDNNFLSILGMFKYEKTNNLKKKRIMQFLKGVKTPLTTNYFECVNFKSQIRLKLTFLPDFFIFYSALIKHKSQPYIR